MSPGLNEFTHWGLVTHICVSNLDDHYFKQWLVTIFGQNMIWFIFKSEYVVSKKSAILLSGPQCLNKIHLVHYATLKSEVIWPKSKHVAMESNTLVQNCGSKSKYGWVDWKGSIKVFDNYAIHNECNGWSRISLWTQAFNFHKRFPHTLVHYSLFSTCLE